MPAKLFHGALLLAAAFLPRAQAITASAPAVDAGTKVTWGRVVQVQGSRAGTRLLLATPSGERAVCFRPGDLPVRDEKADFMGDASTLQPGQQVRVYFRSDARGDTLPIEVSLLPAGTLP